MMRGVAGFALVGCVASVLGCGSLDETSEAPTEMGLSEKAQAATAVDEQAAERQVAQTAATRFIDPRKARVHPRVLAELAKSNGVPLKVALFPAEATISVAEYTGGEYGEVTYEDGQLIEGSLNGKPTDNIGFAAASDEMRKGYARARRAAEAARRLRWKELASVLDLGPELAGVIDDGAASVEVTLPPDLILRAGEIDSSLLTAIELAEHGAPSQWVADIPVATALASIDITTVAFPGGWDGTNIGIYSRDFGTLDTSVDCINSASNRLFRYSTAPPYSSHGTEMVCTIQATAPQARVFYSVAYGSCGEGFPSAAIPDGTTVPKVWVSTISDNWLGGGDYTACDRNHDNSIMLTRLPLFNSTANANSYAASPSVAYNVFGIGMSWAGSVPNTMIDRSNWRDPDTLMVKPELVAPGEAIEIGSLTTGGTSASAAMAAGFVADLMEQQAAFRGRPALLRSFLFANAVRLTPTAGGTHGDRDGYGQIDFSNTGAGLHTFWEGGPNPSFFSQDTDGDGNLEIVSTRTLSSTGTYHAVISWLVDGNTVYSTLKPHLNLDLRVLSPSGTQLGTGVGSTRNVEAVHFNASTTGTYTFIIERTYINAPGDLVLGLTIRKR